MLEYTDIIHNVTFVIPNLFAAIIESADFQRLRSIKQLGFLYLKWENATHTRYDHCIGTYYLANKMLTSLEENTNGLKIPQLYKNCINVAALLHDIGHGPFSHFWEHINTEISHEENALSCIDRIFENIGSQHLLGDSEDDQEFGIELIKGLINTKSNMTFSRPIGDSYRFIFQIVSNSRCGLDVDKWDYLLRDAFYLKDQIDFEIELDFHPIFCGARVSSDGANIEYNYDYINKIFNLFDVRSKFFINLYRVPSIQAIELFVIKCLKIFRLKNVNNAFLETTSDDDRKFLQLTDNNLLAELENSNINTISYIMDRLKKNAIMEVNEKEFIKNKRNKNKMYVKVVIKIDSPWVQMKKVNSYFNQPEINVQRIGPEEAFYYNCVYFKLIE